MDLENIFIIGIILGEHQITRLVCARDKQDAIQTIGDYYHEPEIAFAMCYEEINELYQYSKKHSGFILVVEMNRQPNTNQFMEYREEDSIEVLQEKYKNRDCLFFTGEFIHQLACETDQIFKNPQRPPLISENINV